jgi:hypothetical protein
MSNAELKEFINAHLTGIKAEIKATNDIMTLKFDEVISHQKTTNGRVTQLEREFDCLEKNTVIQRWIKKNPKITAAIMVIFVLMVSAIGDVLGLSTIVKVFKWW